MNKLNPLQSQYFNSNDFISEGMANLKELFLRNGYIVYRFPEIFFSNHDEYKGIYGDIRRGEEDTPDYLAVYTNFDHGEKEGIVVLFEDRIISFCNRHKLNFDDVCFVLLMHELGHWLTHWAVYNGYHWREGYTINNMKLHESLAQIITYWMVDGNPYLERILSKYLTPIDIDNPYYLYNNLKYQSKSNILRKLNVIRDEHYMNNNEDDDMYGFLASEYLEYSDWDGRPEGV
jgi:hypothetical protein